MLKMESDYQKDTAEEDKSDFPLSVPAVVTPQWQHTNSVSMSGIKATLQGESLWQQFNDLGTEMIITKSGRRMFPSIHLTVEGLDPDAKYYVLMDMDLAVDARMKFTGSEWVTAGKPEEFLPTASRLYIHPDSPAAGELWMNQGISMQKTKLTNNTMQTGGNIVLTSMHRYQPRIHIVKTTDCLKLTWSPTATFVFVETQFVAVTAYQNDRITKLKIDNNPFAKGFRETSERSKRKAPSSSVTAVLRPAKRSQSVQSGSSASCTDDSGRSSLGSASPSASVDDHSLMNEHASPMSPMSPYAATESSRLHPFVFPWENFAMGLSLAAARSAAMGIGYSPAFGFSEMLRSQLWRYPYLIPTPTPTMFGARHSCVSYPYPYPPLPTTYQAAPALLQTSTMDQGFSPGTYGRAE